MERCVFRVEKTLLFCNLLNPSKGGDGNSKVTVDTVDWHSMAQLTRCVNCANCDPVSFRNIDIKHELIFIQTSISLKKKKKLLTKNLTNVQTNQCRDHFGRILPLARPWSIHSHDLGSGYGSHEFVHKFPKDPNLDKNSFQVIYQDLLSTKTAMGFCQKEWSDTNLRPRFASADTHPRMELAPNT